MSVHWAWLLSKQVSHPPYLPWCGNKFQFTYLCKNLRQIFQNNAKEEKEIGVPNHSTLYKTDNVVICCASIGRLTINSFDIVGVFGNKVECCFDTVERCFDIVACCFNIVAGVDGALVLDFFRLHSDARSRRHPYKLFLLCSSSTTRHDYFTRRVARAWNNLPENSTNFSNLALFKLSSNILAR